MIVDGLPIDNKTTNTGNLASDAPTSALAFSNRNVDFTNRAADINPEDIESLTVLKGPEAVGAVRHRRGERRDRHHDEARQARLGRFRLQQQLPHRAGAREAGHPEHLRPERHAQHLGSATVVLVLRRAVCRRTRSIYDNIGELLPDRRRRRSTTCRSAAARRTTGSTTASPRRRPSRQGVIPNTGLEQDQPDRCARRRRSRPG